MNKQRRNKLNDAINCIEAAKGIIVNVKNDEEFAFDNMPEGLQYSDRGYKMEENIDNLDEAIDKIEEVVSLINDVIF